MEEHKPVLVKEILEFLDVRRGKQSLSLRDKGYIDATVGGGGHLEVILQKGGEVLGIEQDPKALERAERRLSACSGVFRLVQGNFADIGKIAQGVGFDKVDGILFDLGFASFQVDDPKYGLSFQEEGPLDMRLDPNLGVTAADLVNGLPENELYKLFRETGEEKHSRAIANAIVRRRVIAPFKTTEELAELVEGLYQKTGNWKLATGNYRRLHPATKVFMALRIAVNSELDNLKEALPQAVELLKTGGKLLVISFHSGEDRIVKDFLNEARTRGILKVLTKKPVVPTVSEIEANPRARSAKLRVAERI